MSQKRSSKTSNRIKSKCQTDSEDHKQDQPMSPSNKEINTKLKQSQNRCAQYKANNQKLKSQLKAKEREHNKENPIKQRYLKAMEQNLKLTHSNLELQQQINALIQGKDDIEHKLKLQIQTLDESLKQKETQIASLKSNVITSESDINHKHKSQTENTKHKVTQTESESNVNMQQVRQQIESLTSKIEGYKTEIKKMKESAQIQIKQFTTEKEQHEKDQKEKDDNITRTKEEMKSLNEAMEKESQKYNDLVGEIQQKQEETKQMNDLMNALKKEIESLHSERATSATQLQKTSDDKLRTEKELAQAKQRIKEQGERIQTLHDEMKHISVTNKQETERKDKEYRQKIDTLQVSLNAKQTEEANKLNETVKSLKEELISAQTDAKQWKMENEELTQALNNSYAAAVKDVRFALRKEYDDKLRQYKADIDALQTTEEYKRDVEEPENSNKWSATRPDMDHRSLDANDTESDCVECAQMLVQLSMNRQRLEDELQQRDEYMASLMNTQTKLSQAMQRIKRQEQQIQRLSQRSEHIDIIQMSFDAMKHDMVSYKKEANKLQRETHQLNEQLLSAQTEAKQWKAALKQQNQNESRKFKENQCKYHKHMTVCKGNKERLQEEIDSLKSEIDRITTQVRAKENECDKTLCK
eukprot:568937_1